MKQAINAPLIDWSECSNINVFVDGDDTSLPSAVTVLPGVIDRTQNVIIGHGALDMILYVLAPFALVARDSTRPIANENTGSIANGTLLQIQNMTWGGLQGFQSVPSDPFYVPYHHDVSDSTLAGAGVFGTTITERGLTFVGIDLSGHMVPQYAPTAAFRQVEVLLGRVSSLSSTDPFTTASDSDVAQVSSLSGVSGNFP